MKLPRDVSGADLAKRLGPTDEKDPSSPRRVFDRTGGDEEVDRTVFTDVFVWRDGRWQAVNAQENTVRAH
jgi:hypothetical protein